MTTIYSREITCACCGSIFEVSLIGSTNVFGSMDLDMRPPPMERDTLEYQIHQCPNCDYCAPNLEDAPDEASNIVKSSGYLTTLSDSRFPLLAGKFLAFAHIAKATGDKHQLLWATLRAAWACDDAGQDYIEAAANCRTAAESVLSEIHVLGKSFCDDELTDQILRLDLLRRAGRFDDVADAVAQLRSKNVPDVLAAISRFQGRLAALEDRQCFTVEAAVA